MSSAKEERFALERELGYAVCGVNGCILPDRHAGACLFECTSQRRQRKPVLPPPADAPAKKEAPAKKKEAPAKKRDSPDQDAPAAAAAPRGELRSEVRVREGDGIYDYCWYPLMRSDDPLTCCFLSTSRDHPMHLWDAYDGTLRAPYSAYNHLDEVTAAHSACFEPTGARLYGGFGRAVRIFDVARPGRSCEVRATCPTRKSREGQRGIISCLGFAPDYSGLYAAGSFSGTTGLYVENAPGCIALLGEHTGGVTQLRFSHDGLHLFTAARRDGRGDGADLDVGRLLVIVDDCGEAYGCGGSWAACEGVPGGAGWAGRHLRGESGGRARRAARRERRRRRPSRRPPPPPPAPRAPPRSRRRPPPRRPRPPRRRRCR